MPIATRIRTLLTSIGVGGASTLVDLLALSLLVEVVGLRPTLASFPALAAGALVQFIGCRSVVFRATEERLGPQIVGFAAVELATLALNALAFALLVQALPYPVARLVGSFAVYLGFSYPAWHWVFRRPAET